MTVAVAVAETLLRAAAGRSLRWVTAFPFDPTSAGAQRLARDWVPHLERWEMRVPDGHMFTEGDGTVIEAGGPVVVGATEGPRLVQHGYELVRIHQLRPGG
jgi:hypothetical protein